MCVLNSDAPAVDKEWDTAGSPVVLSDWSGWKLLFNVGNHADKIFGGFWNITATPFMVLILIHLLSFLCLENSSGDVVNVQDKICICIVTLLPLIYKGRIIFLRNSKVRVLPHEYEVGRHPSFVQSTKDS